MFAAGTLFLAGCCTSLQAQDTTLNSNTNGPDNGSTAALAPIFAAFLAEEKRPVTPDEIITSIRTDTNHFMVSVAGRMWKQRERLIGTLLNIFEDGSASNDQKVSAAYYLGEMHASMAVDDLVSNITLQLTPQMSYGGPIASIPNALIQIGTPAIAALIKNLQESDDSNVRELSLMILYQIEGDKDVVQFRLQKALDAQEDATRKARLQAAIKTLPNIQVITKL